ncbi:MAG: TonB family protein [Cyanobacteria bacterium SZAS LIN-3]|nr:TonB family protein [Cyanobacteria bacterium SZAS LIN-3]
MTSKWPKIGPIISTFLCVSMTPALAAQFLPTRCPLPDEEQAQVKPFDPSKASDSEIINRWTWDFHQNTFGKWWNSKIKHLPMSCVVEIDPMGKIGNVTVSKSSGTPKVDREVIEIIKAIQVKPFERKLMAPIEIIVQFFKSGNMRMKLKSGETLTPLGPFSKFSEPTE